MRWIRRAAKAATRRAEWDGLSPEVRRQVCADFSLSEADMTLAARAGGSGRELATLLTRPTLRHLSCSADVLRDMQRVCTFCPEHKRCRAWQANAGAAAKWPAFCPNAYTFASLQRAATSTASQ
jgi:hypothetical protein